MEEPFSKTIENGHATVTRNQKPLVGTVTFCGGGKLAGNNLGWATKPPGGPRNHLWGTFSGDGKEP